MKLVKQEDSMGCGAACVAAILNIEYQDALHLFPNGKKKAKESGFLCREIVNVLNRKNLAYKYERYKTRHKNILYRDGTMVFLKRSKRYPVGHYLCKVNQRWMDPWINFPDRSMRAGFRKRLPSKPMYIIFPESI